MTATPELGQVRWWKSDKGYGRINADSGDVLFCHFSEVQIEGYKELTEGERVEFVRSLEPGPHGDRWVAKSVRQVQDVGGAVDENSGV